MVVGDHQLHAAQAPGAQALEERGPEGVVLAVTDLDTEHLAVPGRGDAGGDYHGPRHDPAPHPALEVGGIGEHIGEAGVVEAPVAEGVEVAVELGADP